MNSIMTVTGPVDASACGMVLSHEHLFIDLSNQAAPESLTRRITPEDRPQLMRDPYCLKDNLKIEQYDSARQSCSDLKQTGCDVIVDCTLKEIGRNPVLLRKLAQETGIHLVMGCGWYTADTHPADTALLSAEQLAKQLIREIRCGVDSTGIRPGIIGEIGTSQVLPERERKTLTAAAIAQQETGLSIQVHVYPWSVNGLEITDLLTRRGVPCSRIVICHSDVTPDWEYIRTLLEKGVYVQLDNFGKEFTPEPGGFASGRFITDRERAELAVRIIREGFAEQLLLTNDICLKCMLPEYGGSGYTHVFRDIVPLLSAAGLDESWIRKVILRENPLRMLSVPKPAGTKL